MRLPFGTPRGLTACGLECYLSHHAEINIVLVVWVLSLAASHVSGDWVAQGGKVPGSTWFSCAWFTIWLGCSEVKERMKKTKADKQAQKSAQPKGGAKATKVMPKAGPKGAKR